jgi:hypothetical protein
VHIIVSAQKSIVDDNCETCQALAEDFDTPMFWHLDGCNMDEDFKFSFYKKRVDYEAERLEWEEFNQEFDKKLAGWEIRSAV